MKRKIVFLMFMLFSFCGAFGGYTFSVANAASVSSDVWTGSLAAGKYNLDEKDLVHISDNENGNVMYADFYHPDKSFEYYIYSATGMAYFANTVNSGTDYANCKIFLETDLSWNNKDWIAIGSVTNPFRGNFNAQGHFIYGANIIANSGDAGIFGYIGAVSTIQNLHIAEAFFGDATNIGGIVGQTYTGGQVTIMGCSANIKDMNTAATNVGGLVGQSGNVVIDNCQADVKISALNSTSLGGLVGKSGTVNILRSSVLGKLDVESGNVGGLVGRLDDTQTSTFQNSYNMANLTNNTSGGTGAGLVGSSEYSIVVSNCYSAGEIEYKEGAGGFYAGLIGNVSRGTLRISNSFVLKYPKTSTELTDSVAVIANSSNLNLKNVYCPETANSNCKLNNLSDLAKTKGFYQNTKYFDANSWDFENVWKISSMVNGSLPYIEAKKSNDNQNASNFAGDGSMQNPYQISSAGDLTKLSALNFSHPDNQGKYYVLQNDINLIGKQWIPIGLSNPFNGVFDGNGHTISGITCNSYTNQGFLAQTSDAVIKNLTIKDCKLSSLSSSQNIGSLIGLVSGTTYIINCKTDEAQQNCYTVGKVNEGAQLTVAYGKTGITVLETDNLNYTFNEAYDIVISPEGGNFYQASKETIDGVETSTLGAIYTGEYHILLDETGNVINNRIDATFGQGNTNSKLPGTSSELDGGDILIKPGFKQSGYAYSDGNFVDALTNQTNLTKAISGLKAVWTQKSVTLKVVYNAYELDAFGKADGEMEYGNFNVNGQSFAIEKGGDNKVYINFAIPYDSMLKEIDFLKSVPKFVRGSEEHYLRDNKFEIEGIYSTYFASADNFGEFGGKIDFESRQFINAEFVGGNSADATYQKTLYTKWTGKQNATGTVNLKINYTDKDGVTHIVEDDQSALWKELVAGTGIDAVAALQTGSTGNNYSFCTKQTYTQSSGNLTVDSADANSAHYVRVLLNDGYQITGNSINIEYTTLDPYFGKLRGTNEDEGKIVAYDNGSVGFKNLANDITITYNVKIATYIDEFVAQGDFFLGLGTKEAFVVEKNADNTYASNFVLKKGDGFVDVLFAMGMVDEAGDAKPEFVSTLNTWLQQSQQAKSDPSKTPLYLGFDLKNNKIVFSSSEFDGQDYNFDVWITSQHPTGIKLALFGVKKQLESGEIVDFYGIIEDKVQKDEISYLNYVLFDPTSENFSYDSIEKFKIVSYSYGNEKAELNQISYNAFESFVMIASTENPDATFNACEYINVSFSEDTFKRIELGKSNADGDAISANTKWAKHMLDFNKVTREGKTNDSQEDVNSRLQIISKYTSATFAFDFVYCDEDGVEKETPANFEMGKPVAKFDGSNMIKIDGDESERTIAFYVESTDFYQLLGKELFGENNTFKNFNIIVSDYDEKDQINKYEGDIIYSTLFNSNSSIKTLYKGQAENVGLEKYQNLTYKITLVADANSLINGKYTIRLKCKDVPYTLNASAGIVDYGSINGKSDAQIAAGIQKIDGAPQIGVTESQDENGCGITVNGQEGIFKATPKFDEIVNLQSLSTNGGYILLGWYLQSENISKFVRTSELSGEFKDFYLKNDNLENSDGKEDFAHSLAIKAIWVRKQVAFTFNNFYIPDSSENAAVQIMPQMWLGFDMSLGMEDEFSTTTLQNNNYSYAYSSANPTDLILKLVGNNASGYYFAGYKLVQFKDGKYEEVKTVNDYNSFNVDVENGNLEIDMAWLKDELESGDANALMSGTYFKQLYIQPILKQKTATIIFHSGTGDESNKYGDKFGGTVFDAHGNTVSNEIYTLKNITFGQNVAFGNVVLESGSELTLGGAGAKLNQLFASRTGYQYTGIWTNGTSFSSSNNITLNASYFLASTETLYLHLYLTWSANQYKIIYNSNHEKLYGAATGTTLDSGALYYDNPIVLAENGFSVTGYHFVGWSKNQNAQSAEYANGATLTRSEFNALVGDLANTNNGTIWLYAIWAANSYVVEINYAGGTFEGQDVGTFNLKYNSSFANLKNLSETPLGLNAIKTTRKGFDLLGFYVQSGQNRQEVLMDTVLNTALLSSQFLEEGSCAVTLFADWSYSANADFQLSTTQLSGAYTGTEISVSVADYIKLGYTSNYINADDFDLSPLTTTLKDVLVEASLSCNNSAVQISGNLFRVKNAGDYNLTLVLKLTDANTVSNLGVLQTINVVFSYVVLPAQLQANWNENLAAYNAKRLMQNFVQGAETISNLSDLAAFVRSKEEISINVSNQQICDYVTTKYYLLLCTNDGELYKTYKQWLYDDYVSFVEERSDLSGQILNNARYFAFYNLNSTSDDIDFYNSYLTLQNEDVFGVSNDILVDKVKVVSDTGSMQTGNSYALRAYLQNTDALANYQLSYDSRLRQYYLNVGKCYIMPMPVVVQNLSETNSTFFSSLYSNRLVDWSIGERAWEDLDYFQLEDLSIEGLPVYVRGSLYTNAAGKADEDTNFSFKGDQNFLYFENVSFILTVSDFYIDYTANFKLILSDDYVYTILKTTDVLKLDVEAKYLTINQNTQYFDKINSENINLADLASVPDQLLAISRVTYEMNGTKATVLANKNQLYVDGVLIYEILANNANTVSIMLNSAVKKVEFNANQLKIGDFIHLYKWVEGEYSFYGVQDDAVSNGLYTYEVKEMASQEELSNITVSAIFTDLVRAEFNLNFPASFAADNYAYLRLGKTTALNFDYPHVEGFTLVSLKQSGTDLDLTTAIGKETFFNGAGGTYVGLDANAPRKTITFNALWNVAPISGTPLMSEYVTAVSSFSYLNASDVAYLNNINQNVFDYTYAWLKWNGTQFELVSNQEVFTLANGGGVDDSGLYQLQLIANLKQEFLSCLADKTVTSSSFDVNFNITFKLHLLTGIQMPDTLHATYNSLSHLSDWNVGITYAQWDRLLQNEDGTFGGYGQPSTMTFGYSADADVYFDIYFGADETAQKVTDMVNAGTYTVYIKFKDDKFDTSAYNGQKSFTFVIDPLDINLKQLDFNGQKAFNTLDPDFVLETTVGGETLEILYQRNNLSEDVGQYNLYLSANQNANYRFKFDDVVLYQNGALTSAAATTVLGKFDITASGTLKLDFGDKLNAVYSADGFTAEISNDFHLIIKSNGKVVKDVNITLFDVAQGMQISDEIVEILKAYASDITLKFLNGQSFDVAVNAGQYRLIATTGSEFAKYFTAVEFVSTSVFEITPYEIDITTLNFDKTYDGKDTKSVKLDGYNMYVVAKYNNGGHAGQNIAVSLSLQGGLEGVQENTANFKLKNTSVNAQISKLSANLEISLKQETMHYGDVSKNNIKDLLDLSSVIVTTGIGENLQDVTSLLISEYYSFVFSLNTTKTNAAGYAFAGSYTVDASQSSFNDFDMTILPINFTVLPTEITAPITQNYITVSTQEEIKPQYQMQLPPLATTGDQLSYNLTVLNGGVPVTGGTLEEGVYALQGVGAVDGKLVLKVSAADEQGSVVVVIEANTGFTVVSAAQTLYAVFADEEVLTQEYNGTGFTFEYNKESNSFTLNSNPVVLNFFKDDQTTQVTGLSFESFVIYNGIESNTTFKNAGTYTLSAKAVCSDAVYSNIILNANFVITKQVVDVESLEISKTYDGTATKDFEVVGKFADDDVYIRATFNSADVNKATTAELVLQGKDAANYVLSSKDKAASITPAVGTLKLDKNKFVYGEISNGNNFVAGFVSAQDANGNTISPMQYLANVQILNATYSPMAYLVVDGYAISVTATCDNYTFAQLDTNIVIERYQLEIVFSKNGQISVPFGTELDGNKVPFAFATALFENASFTLTRNSTSTAIGLYKILEGTYISEDGNYQASVTDASTGAFEIVKAVSMLYVLFEQGANVDNNLTIPKFYTTYNANTYNSVRLENIAGKWNLVVYNSANSAILQTYALAFYTLEDDKYVLFNGQVDGLNVADIKFANNRTAKNVGQYQISASGAVSSSYDVKIGKRGSQYAFTFEITPKQITFKAGEDVKDENSKTVLKNGLFTRTFNGKNAVYNFAGTQLLDGLAAGEEIGIEITLKNGNQIGHYTGTYSVQAVLVDAQNVAANYTLKTITQSGNEFYLTAAGDRVVGEISYAPIVVKFDNQTFTYGDFGLSGGVLDLSLLESKVSFVTDFEFDLSSYNRTFDWYLSLHDAKYSAADKLAVGTFTLSLTFSSDDFIVGGYLINNVSKESFDATLKIEPKMISVKQLNGGEDLQTIFTKTFDGTADANIYNGSALRFALDGAFAQDNIQIISATYSNTMGTSLDVTFELDEVTGANYVVEPYHAGVINPVKVSLKFDYDHQNISSSLDGQKEIESIAYPFVNSVSVSGNGEGGFPATLNKPGSTFMGWTINFAGLTTNQKTYLENLKKELGFVSVEENGLYKISVADNAVTIALINGLLSDNQDTFNKYYFALHENIEIVFTPNFNIVQQSLEVQVTDLAGKNSQLGTIEVWVGSDESTMAKIATVNGQKLYIGNFDYNSAISLKIWANSHNFIETVYVNSQANTPVSTDAIEWNFKLYDDTHIAVSFAVQQVNVVVDVSDVEDASFNDARFQLTENNQYLWQTDYVTLAGVTLQDINKIARFGYNLNKLTVNGTDINAGDFAAQNLQDLITSASDKTFDINLLATADSFTAQDVEITLDYAYDGQVKTVTAKFGQTYGEVVGQTPTREGFVFNGWTYNNQPIALTDTILFTESRTLQAQWRLEKFSLTISAEHAAVEGAFIQNQNIYVANNLTFGSIISFKIIPSVGYAIDAKSENWTSNFAVTIVGDAAQVEYTVPAYNNSFVVPVLPKINIISIEGNKVAKVEATNVTQNTAVSIENGQLQIATDETLKLVATAAEGYDMLQNVIISDETGITYNTTLQDGVLSVEIFGNNKNITITLQTAAKENQITIEFVDENGDKFDEAVDYVVLGNTSVNLENLPQLFAKTDADFSFGVGFKYGYRFVDATSSTFTVLKTTQNGIANITLKAVKSAGSVKIVAAKQKFTIKTQALSYDDNNMLDPSAANIVLVNGSRLPSGGQQFEFGSTLNVSGLAYGAYTFAGWSFDGITIASREKELSYTVTQDATIYAHFSAGTFVADLGGLDYTQKYLDGILQDEFTETEIQCYSVNGMQIQSIQIHFGTSAQVRLKIPKGYGYYGFGYFDTVDKQYRIFEDKRQGQENEFGDVFVDAYIYSNALSNMLAGKVYFVITSYSAEALLDSVIDFDGTQLPNTNNAGKIEICDAVGNVADLQVRDVLYLNGTRVHYKDVNKSAIISYTNEDFYIKVSSNAGYTVGGAEIFGNDVKLTSILQTETYHIYRVSQILGGEKFNIVATFKPILNNINISFSSTGETVFGGSFDIKENGDLKQVWISGQSYDNVSVAAYTGSSFVVTAYIGAGYVLQDAKILGADGLIKDITMQALNVQHTGYNGKIIFVVENVMQSCEIKIMLVPRTYTVVLKDGSNILAKIKGVQFGTNIDLSYNNHQNIEIIDARLGYVANKLNLVLKQNNHNFEGYFSAQNGGGVQYINYACEVVSPWKETGYSYNSLSGKYELSSNCNLVDEGDIEVSLYLYQSYLKTRLQFEILPKLYNLTAKQMIKGVDDTNSWFYSASPNYIEVAFNTKISITAPQVEGFKFYKFKISQQLADGTWLADVNSYFDAVPWSTNEYDKVVQVLVQVIYFAEVDVEIEGGEGRFAITQNIPADAQTQRMWDMGYVDTSVDFAITAVPATGYNFDHWTILDTNSVRWNDTIHLRTAQKLHLKMTLVGQDVTLDFADYATNYGAILRMNVKSPTGIVTSHVLAKEDDGNFVKLLQTANVKVGDQITFILSINQGFAATWNRDDIVYQRYENNLSYFSFVVPPECANTSLAILPTFSDKQLSFSITSSLDILEGAFDNNDVEAAGYLKYNNKKVWQFTAMHGQDVAIELITNERYAVKGITIKNMQNVFDNMQDFVVDGNIVLTDAFITQNSIVGNVAINIEYARLMWEEETLPDDFVGNGTRKNPYHIGSVADLVLMMQLCNNGSVNDAGSKYKDSVYVLDVDLTLGEKFWTPIGTQEVPFAGTFDFNGHTITDIHTAVIYQQVEYNGLFGVLGTNAVIILKHTSIWWIWLLIIVAVVLIVLIVIVVFVSYNRKKRREQMAKH